MSQLTLKLIPAPTMWCNVCGLPADIYPVNWPAISLKVRQEADWRCEWCGVECHRPGSGKPTKPSLTVSHLNRVKLDVRRVNLAALCWPCHKGFDAGHTRPNPHRKCLALTETQPEAQRELRRATAPRRRVKRTRKPSKKDLAALAAKSNKPFALERRNYANALNSAIRRTKAGDDTAKAEFKRKINLRQGLFGESRFAIGLRMLWE